MTELAPKYDPKAVEKRLLDRWDEAGYSTADPDRPGEPFSIVIPPPNVTGVLHIGHALNGTIQDILTRWRRMQGRNTLWLPGTDHAGIATQHVVSNKLRREGVDPRGLTREQMLEHIWKWKNEHGSTIIHQLRTLGCSCDFTRERFTMDEGLSRAVKLVFKRLFDEGLIYRGDYMVNWSPKLGTALSDDEVEHREVDGSLWYFRYPYADGSGHAVVATTRPETMLGDTAVAVNPSDERFQDLIGKTVRLPLMNRMIPIIGDAFVSAEFGTGMVKVTPAHDPNDYEIGKRHDLEFINLIEPDGTMNENAGAYAGLSIREARRRVVADLEAEDLIEKIEPHRHVVGHCYRSGCVIEPYISKQWFVKMRPLAEPAMEAVRRGRVEFIPKSWEKTYFQWLEDVRDWCISRQLIWGHRIPVFTCGDCGHVACVIEGTPEKCGQCGGADLTQDPDVLDTWFSSALWPFSTMGWPEPSATLKTYYPTSVLVTAHDIIFFWVARMIMMGLKFMGDAPFRQVFFTPLIMAEGGGKMSKSKGNAVDPLEIIENHGADAIRLALAAHAGQARTVSLSMKRFEGYRNFTNKLWNAARFVLMNTSDLPTEALATGVRTEELELEDRWILSALEETRRRATRALEQYKFDEYMNAAYDFTWKQYCDWYLELVKTRLHARDRPEASEADRASRRRAQIVLVETLENILRLLHPVAPFITEEIWQRLKSQWGGKAEPGDSPVLKSLETDSIVLAPWPGAERADAADPDAGEEIELLQEVIYIVRKIRGEMNVPPSTAVEVEVATPNERRRAMLEAQAPHFQALLRLSDLRFTEQSSDRAFAATGVFEDITVRVPLPEELREREIGRLGKEIHRLEDEIGRIEGKLGNDQFVSRAPTAVVDRERHRLATHGEERDNLKARLQLLRS